MVATARVTVLMEHVQKARLAERAKTMGMSVGEYIRSKALDKEGHKACWTRCVPPPRAPMPRWIGY